MGLLPDFWAAIASDIAFSDLATDADDLTIDMAQNASGAWEAAGKPYVTYPYDPASPPVVVFGMPTLKQCKKIFWKPLINLLEGQPFVESINRSDFTIKLTGDRPELVCVGLNDADGDRVRGLRIAAFIGDEFQDVRPIVWDEVVEPAMADTPGAIALLTGTPKGKVNHLYSFFNRGAELPGWASFTFKTADNPHIPRAEIERARVTKSPRVFRQEYEASWENFPGQIMDALCEDHLQPVERFPSIFDTVLLGVDWGDVNPALVAIGVKRYGRDASFYVLDTWYSDAGVNILDSHLRAEAGRLIKRWGVRWGYCGRDRPASIETWNKLFRGVRFLGGFNKVAERNSLCNDLLHHRRLWIADHLRPFYDKLGSYHRRQLPNGMFLDEPAPGQDDHEADSLCHSLAAYVYDPPASADWVKGMRD